MDRQRMNTQVQDMIKEEQHTKGIVDTIGVLEPIPAMVEAVKVDKDYMKACIQRLVDSNINAKNPLNGILAIFGLRLVRYKKEEEFRVYQDKSMRNELESMLKLDERAFRAAVSTMVSALGSYQQEREENQEEDQGTIKQLQDQLQQQERETSQLQADAKAQLQTIAGWLQSMLAALGPDAQETAGYGQLTKLAGLLDIEIFWNAQNGPLRQSAMYKEMKVGDISKYKTQPCLIYDGEVLAQGIRFCQAGGGQEPQE